MIRERSRRAAVRSAVLSALVGLGVVGCRAPWSLAVPFGGGPEPEPLYHLSPGQLVRVMAPSFGIPRGTATVMGMSGDSLVLTDVRLESAPTPSDSRPDTARRAVPLSSLGSLEIYVGRRPDPGAGALLGILVGGGLGALVWGGRSDCSIGFQSTPCAVPGFLVGAALGAAAGAAFGEAVLRTARWERVPLDRLARVRVGIVVRPGSGPGVGASIAF